MNQPITDALYGKKRGGKRPPEPARPRRQPRPVTVGELLPASQATALVALKAELESAAPAK
ncbi:MAG: hypothetical protein LC118_17460, partial [Dehalococcoidia bacterium]|nr:hypothetical protein [Dehalococcoidia bacterium]